MKAFRSLVLLWVVATVALVLIGCTLEEWGRIKDDVVAQVPETLDDIAENPTPVGLILAGVAAVSMVLSKTVRRGFGKGWGMTKNTTIATGARIGSAVASLLPKKPPEEPPASA